MKARNVTIRISSMDETLDRFAGVYERASRGEKVVPQEILSFETPELMREMLTKERLRTLKTIREKEPKTIYALAKMLQRPYSNVFNDVKKLAEMGLIDLRKENGTAQPRAKYDRLNITIPI
ncbi:MAG TPA: MarR family transcriptional regulator [archaeon]|nr:MarR family transcriptional regulator [archaeon]